MAFAPGHARAVRSLYRKVLKVHKMLPLEFKALGDEYAKDEFRRHKDCNKEQADIFMLEWQNYCNTLENQKEQEDSFGKNLSDTEIDLLSQEQMGQLFELQKETTKPRIYRDSEDKKQ